MLLAMYLTSTRRLCRSIVPRRPEKAPSEASGNTTSLLALPTGILEGARLSAQVMMTPSVVRQFISILLPKMTPSIVWDIRSPTFKTNDIFPSLRPFCHIRHNCQTVSNAFVIRKYSGADYVFQGKWLTILRAQWSPNPDAYPHFTVANMNHALDMYSSKVCSVSLPLFLLHAQSTDSRRAN